MTASSTTTSCTTCASWPGSATSSTSPTVSWTRASSTSSRASRRAPGASRTRRTTSARGRCWRATWSAGTGWTRTTRWCSPTTAASWSGRSTRCSPRWTAAPATGGACRPRRWSSTRTTSATTASMPLADAKRDLIGPRRWSDVLYLHLSSYFQVLRRPVLDDPGFRFRLDTVCGQRTKQLVVDKYEIGIGRYLMDSGFEFDTWTDALHPFHPMYSRRTFDHVAAGFPLVKRNFLAENPRDVPGFAAWPDWLRQAAPEAPMDMIQASIDRVSPARPGAARPARVRRRDGPVGGCGPQPPWQGYGFRSMDEELPKFAHWWAFPVSSATHRLDPGARAVFEAVRDDPTIRKVVLTRSRRLDLDGENVVVLPLETREGQAAARAVPGDPARHDRRAPRSTCRCPRNLHHFVHVGQRPADRAGSAGRSAIAARRPSRTLASDYRRLNAMVVASKADAHGQGRRHSAQPASAVADRSAPARPGDPPPTTPFPTTCVGQSRSCATGWAAVAWWCSGRDRADAATGVLGRRAGPARRVVPPARRRPRRPRGRGRPPGSLTQTLTPVGAWGLSARRMPDPPSCCGWPMRWSPTTPTRPSTSCSRAARCSYSDPERRQGRAGRTLPARDRPAGTGAVARSTSSWPPSRRFRATGRRAGRRLPTRRRLRLRPHRRPVGVAARGTDPASVRRR